MRFGAAVGVPKKSGVARLFKVFATAMLANFQDHLVMTASITLRIQFSFSPDRAHNSAPGPPRSRGRCRKALANIIPRAPAFVKTKRGFFVLFHTFTTHGAALPSVLQCKIAAAPIKSASLAGHAGPFIIFATHGSRLRRAGRRDSRFHDTRVGFPVASPPWPPRPPPGQNFQVFCSTPCIFACVRV